jgi:putative transposase
MKVPNDESHSTCCCRFHVELSHPARTIHRTMRHTTFRFALDPTMRQQQALVRHAGASRYAYNQCLRLLADSLSATETDPSVDVPWSGFDLIEKFNQWKRSEAAGRTFAVAGDGTITKRVTGLAWRHEVSAQVFEEAAVDLGRALAAFSDSRSGTRVGRTIGFPKPKRKGRCKDSFRLRNKTRKNGRCSIRIGEDDPRSVTLPTMGLFAYTMTPVACVGYFALSGSTTPVPERSSSRLGPRSCSQR